MDNGVWEDHEAEFYEVWQDNEVEYDAWDIHWKEPEESDIERLSRVAGSQGVSLEVIECHSCGVPWS